jgi:predicted Zn-dependent protease
VRRVAFALAGVALALVLALPGAPPRADDAPAEGAETPETEASPEPAEEEPEERRPPVLDTVYDDERVGREESERVDAAIGLVDDEALTEYVAAIGERLARHAPRHRFDYTFRVVDQDEPNAFALPGGYIFVSRGLLALTNSEDELANVIGHEIAHVAARHAAARQAVQEAMPGLVRFLARGSLAGYSRSQEKEADRLGQGIAALAGYDPDGMAEFLKHLEFTERLRLGASRRPYFLDTHPATQRRTAVAAQRARVIAWKREPTIARDPRDYLRRLDGLVVGTSAAEGIFRGDRFIHVDMGLTLRFPAGWETHNAHTAVGALAPDRTAQVVLEHAGPGRDLEKAFTSFTKKTEGSGLRIERTEKIKLAGRDALRAYGRAGSAMGGVDVWVTFLTHGDQTFRITGVARGEKDRNETLFMQVARSFRSLPPDLIKGVKENRLRIVEAKPGESLADLSTRTGNQWPINHTAVMNHVFATDPLEGGQLVKVAIAQPYRPDARADR